MTNSNGLAALWEQDTSKVRYTVHDPNKHNLVGLFFMPNLFSKLLYNGVRDVCTCTDVADCTQFSQNFHPLQTTILRRHGAGR